MDVGEEVLPVGWSLVKNTGLDQVQPGEGWGAWGRGEEKEGRGLGRQSSNVGKPREKSDQKREN